MKKVTVHAPASIGNVSVGFDILGAAVSPVDGTLLGDTVTVSPSAHFELVNSGRFVSKLPSKKEDNIVYQAWELFCNTLGREVPVLMVLEKNMPIGSGLGSSACSIVAALVALNTCCDNPLSKQQLLLLMGELEGKISGGIHYDNVAPCFLGGLQIILEQGDIISQPVPCFDQWLWVMAYPGIKVSTAEARAILPATYSKQTCIVHGRNVGGFVHACYSQQPHLAAELIQDVIAEPYRQRLLPGFTQAKQTLLSMGSLACGISGSGPTMFAIADKMDIAEKLALWLSENYIQNESGFVHICKLDKHGARCLDSIK